MIFVQKKYTETEKKVSKKYKKTRKISKINRKQNIKKILFQWVSPRRCCQSVQEENRQRHQNFGEPPQGHEAAAAQGEVGANKVGLERTPLKQKRKKFFTRELNPAPLAWKASALPLHHSVCC